MNIRVGKACVLALLGLCAAAVNAQAQPSFADTLYPVLEKAGCRACHNPEGVASPTRLHFPEESASKTKVEAFGKSLVELVDRADPDNSLLWKKPTNRIKHSGGERIKQGSPEEAQLKQWIHVLASLSGDEVKQALRYKQLEAAGSGTAAQVVLRRLTNAQYDNTVHDLLREPTDPADVFPAEDYVDGFKNQYKSQAISPIQAEAYSITAEQIAANAFRRGDSRHLIPCTPRGANDRACRVQFIETFGRRAFRRPLDPVEVARYETLFKTQGNFLKGAQTVIEAMLQSPSFLYWMEQTSNPKWKQYAVASRLSYFLWNTMPDESLMESAAKGNLGSSEEVARAARRMLDDPRAEQGLNEFVSEWLRFDRALSASRTRGLFPLFTRDVAAAMTVEAKRFIGDLAWKDKNFMGVYTADYGFVNSDLAAIYKVPPPAHEFELVRFPPEQGRSGILGQALFLTLTSKLDDTAPTGRGLFIREQFLCQHVPPPPPDVDTNLPPVTQDRPVTNRERMSAHTTEKACAGCHHLIDPIGFGLENYDAVGEYREKQTFRFNAGRGEKKGNRKGRTPDVSLPLDTHGDVAGLPAPEFTSVRQLGSLLANAEQCQECIVKQVFRYMSGRQDTSADVPAIRRALDDFKGSGFHYREMVVSLVKQWDFPPLEGREHVASNHQTH